MPAVTNDARADLAMLDSLIDSASARYKAAPSKPAKRLLDALRGAKTFLLLLGDAEADHAKR